MWGTILLMAVAACVDPAKIAVGVLALLVAVLVGTGIAARVRCRARARRPSALSRTGATPERAR